MAKVSVDTTGAGGVDDSTVLLLNHVGIGSLGDLVSASQVNVHDDVPLVVGHVRESLVAEDASVVDEDINSSVGINGGLHDSITILN